MNRLTLLSTLALAAAFLPSSAMAWKFVCDTYQVIECGDGTTFACSAGGQQIDCPDNEASWAAYAYGCEGHGGIVGVTGGTITSIDFEERELAEEEPGDDPSPTVAPTRER